MKTLLIWGSGGHGRVVLDVARAMRCFEEIVFYDNGPDKPDSLQGVPILSGRVGEVRPPATTGFLIAIGSNRIRSERYAEAVAAGFTPVACVHPSAVVSPTATIGGGTVVMPNAVIQNNAVIGVNCIINTAAIVEHDCVVGDHAHLSPTVALGGGASVGAFAHMGIGAVAIPGTKIGEGTVVGAGGVVIRDIPAHVTVAGVPAEVITSRNSR